MKRMPPIMLTSVRAPWHWVSLGFGSGLSPWLPGTVGTWAGWVSYWWLTAWFTPEQFWWWWPWTLIFGVWCCHQTGLALGVPDHGAIVWDEMVAFWLVLAFTPVNIGAQVAAFVLFRAFDMLKPPPIAWFDARWKNGFGVMWDDLLAAGMTLACLYGWQYGSSFF